jgi:hypothetical protein
MRTSGVKRTDDVAASWFWSPNLARGPRNTESLHTIAKSVGTESEDFGRAPGSGNDPAGLFKDRENVVFFHRL